MSKAIATIKDAFVWQANLVEDHPWLTIGGIWILAGLAIAF